MPDYCPYAWLIPWTTEGQAYAKEEREKKERDLEQKAACRKQKKIVLGRMANARKRTRRLAPGMRSAAQWGDNAAERWAEMCRREERIIHLKECRSKIANRIEAKKESIRIEENELDELEQELEKLDEEIGA